MRIILLMGTSSVGKSTVCRALKENYQFYIVKNGDEYLDEHLKTVEEQLKEKGIMEKLSPPMRPDEIMLFCISKQLNIASAPQPLTDVQIENLSEVDTQLIAAGYDEGARRTLTENLKLAKDVFDANPGPKYETSIERSFSEALDLGNRDKTVVLDFVPESTPAKTKEVLDSFTKRAEQYGRDNQIDVSVKKVLIYCPMQKLSDNMEARNRRAEENENIVDKRVGINPILMLSSLATAEESIEKSEERELMQLSRSELHTIVERGAPTDEVEKQYSQLIGDGDGKWFHGFRFPEGQNEVTLRIPNELQFDCKTNNSGLLSPSSLAKEMVDKLEFGIQAVANQSHPLDTSQTGSQNTTQQYRQEIVELKQVDKPPASLAKIDDEEMDTKSSITPLSITPKPNGSE